MLIIYRFCMQQHSREYKVVSRRTNKLNKQTEDLRSSKVNLSFSARVWFVFYQMCESLCVYERLTHLFGVFPHLCARVDISTHAFPSQAQNGSLANTQS